MKKGKKNKMKNEAGENSIEYVVNESSVKTNDVVGKTEIVGDTKKNENQSFDVLSQVIKHSEERSNKSDKLKKIKKEKLWKLRKAEKGVIAYKTMQGNVQETTATFDNQDPEIAELEKLATKFFGELNLDDELQSEGGIGNE